MFHYGLIIPTREGLPRLAYAPSLVIVPPQGWWAIFVGAGFANTFSGELDKDLDLQTSFYHGTLGLCLATPGRRPVHGLLCAGALVGELSARGSNIPPTKLLVAGPLAGGRVTFTAFSPFLAYFGLGLVVPVARAEIGALSSTDVAGMAEFGVGLSIP